MEHHQHGDHLQNNLKKADPHTDHNSPMGHAGHDHHIMMIDDFRKRFYVVLILTIPVMLLSPMIQRWLNLYWEFIGSGYLLALLSSIVFFYGGWPFLRGWFDEMRGWKPGMMTLIGLQF
jgi:Cu2+-exporting ATPase